MNGGQVNRGSSTAESDAWKQAFQALLEGLTTRWQTVPPSEQLAWTLVLAGGVLLLVLLVLWRRALGRTGRANRGRQRQAQRAESSSERFLSQMGYEILERQCTQRWQLRIDGASHEVHCRADLLLRKRGKLYVADVKTGGKAPDPRSPATRRQLLEYFLVFAVDGVLLVDMEQRRVRAVAFPDLLR